MSNPSLSLDPSHQSTKNPCTLEVLPFVEALGSGGISCGAGKPCLKSHLSHSGTGSCPSSELLMGETSNPVSLFGASVANQDGFKPSTTPQNPLKIKQPSALDPTTLDHWGSGRSMAGSEFAKEGHFDKNPGAEPKNKIDSSFEFENAAALYHKEMLGTPLGSVDARHELEAIGGGCGSIFLSAPSMQVVAKTTSGTMTRKVLLGKSLPEVERRLALLQELITSEDWSSEELRRQQVKIQSQREQRLQENQGIERRDTASVDKMFSSESQRSRSDFGTTQEDMVIKEQGKARFESSTWSAAPEDVIVPATQQVRNLDHLFVRTGRESVASDVESYRSDYKELLQSYEFLLCISVARAEVKPVALAKIAMGLGFVVRVQGTSATLVRYGDQGRDTAATAVFRGEGQERSHVVLEVVESDLERIVGSKAPKEGTSWDLRAQVKILTQRLGIPNVSWSSRILAADTLHPEGSRSGLAVLGVGSAGVTPTPLTSGQDHIGVLRSVWSVVMRSQGPIRLVDLPREVLHRVCAHDAQAHGWGQPWSVLHITSGLLFRLLRNVEPPLPVKKPMPESPDTPAVGWGSRPFREPKMEGREAWRPAEEEVRAEEQRQVSIYEGWSMGGSSGEDWPEYERNQRVQAYAVHRLRKARVEKSIKSLVIQKGCDHMMA